MGEFDLKNAFLGAGALAENFENQPSAIKNLGFPCSLQIPLLYRRQLAVDDGNARFRFGNTAGDFLNFACANQCRGCWMEQRDNFLSRDEQANCLSET